jgi:cystathionine gamma-lyase
MTITQNGDAAQVEYTAGQASNTNGSTNGHHSRHHDSYTTRAIHVGSEPDPSTGAVVPSLSVATTFLQDGIGKDRVSHGAPSRNANEEGRNIADTDQGYDYSRSINPTRSALEAVLTSLETSPASSTTSNGQHDQHDGSGGDSLVFASGSAATAAISHWVSLPTVEGGAGGKDGENGVGGHILAVNDVVRIPTF